jgi:PadR family transcriptional regulator, regulatory protein PadR
VASRLMSWSHTSAPLVNNSSSHQRVPPMRTSKASPGGGQDLYSNLIHLYVLHQAYNRSTFGMQIIEEVARFGYKLSPGTMYPLLKAFEKKGMLRSRLVQSGGTVRRIYRATAAGRKAYGMAKQHVEMLLGAISDIEIKRRIEREERALER